MKYTKSRALTQKRSIYLCMSDFSDFENGFTPVLWLTLTSKNGGSYHRFASQVSQFLIELSHTLKCHLKIHRAGEKGFNLHEHVIVLIPDAELKLYQERKHKFTPWQHWRFRTLDFQEWKPEFGHGAFVYLNNHPDTYDAYIVCPKYLRKCRKSLCPHD